MSTYQKDSKEIVKFNFVISCLAFRGSIFLVKKFISFCYTKKIEIWDIVGEEIRQVT